MRSSFCQSNKSLLSACVVFAILAGAVTANAQTPPAPAYWGTQAEYVMNAFTATTNEYLTGIGFWTADGQATEQAPLTYQISVYGDLQFDGDGQLSDFKVSATGNLSASGYHPINFSQVEFAVDEPYYVVLGLSNTIGDPKYGLFTTSDETEAGYQSDTYTFEGGNGGWITSYYAPASEYAIFALTPITAPVSSGDDGIRIVDSAGDWTYANEEYVPTDTLTANITATDNGPYDLEIEVTGGMDPITLSGSLLNDTGEDWAGLRMQLGHGLGEDFQLAGDGVTFTGLGINELAVSGPIASDGEPKSLAFGINLPGDDPYTFTLRMMAIPEPASVLLLTIAGLLLMLRRKR